MKKTTIPLIILLTVALIGGLMLVKQNQETRKGASFANTKLMLLPSEKIIKAVGEVVPVKVYYQTESGAKVDGVQAVVCYGDELTLDPDTGVVGNTENGFEAEPIVSIKDGCATLVTASKKAADQLKTTGEAFAINFMAAKVGEGNLTINQAKSMVTGDNTSSAIDKEIAITGVENTTYQITGDDPITGDELILNLKGAFGHVKAAGGECVVNWPLQVIVLGGGESKVYSGVVATSQTKVGDLVVYQGSLPLVGFNHSENVAVFVKGPKHLQMKYAVQDQSGPYNEAGGKLSLTNSVTTSPVYDFTKYPMIPGDVTSEVEGVQDGWVNGIDFAYVKARALTHESVDSGGYLRSDLDGNCQVNSNDVNILKISLQTKQGQLY
jgi:hypothetical protein